MISIIVPIYNTEKYLCKCIDSILNQTFKDIEVILVDDGSTDSSGEICDEYAKRDPRVVVIHKENGGQATARNMALDIAKGEYIGFVDSDDFIEPEMYAALHEAIMKTNSDIAMCGKFLVSADYATTTNRFVLETQTVWEEDEIIRRFLLSDNIGSSPCDKLIKRELFDFSQKTRFPCGYICEDLLPIFELLCKSRKLVHVGKAYYNYYQRESSTSRGGATQEKTYGIIIYPKQINEIVINNYAEYSVEANYYYAIRLMSFLVMLDPKCNKTEYKTRRKELLKYKYAIKRYGRKNEKRLFVLFKLNLFYVLRKAKRLFKKK